MDEEQKTYSVALRVRRTVYEDAYVAVPVTDAILKNEVEGDGSRRIDFEAFVSEAIRLSRDPRVEWKVESTTTTPHPTQCPMPIDRKSFDGFYELSE